MLKKATYSFLIIIFLVFLAEFLIRLWQPQDLISDILILDNDVGHRLKPNASGVQNSVEFKTNIRINSLGLRDSEYSTLKKSSTFRILVLGDSHTFGWGVEHKNIFTEQIEHELNEGNQIKKYEVLNCGVYGYGTGHQYKFLKKYGLPLIPDLVIFAVDFLHDVRVNNSGYFYFENDEIWRSSKTSLIQKSRKVTQFIPFSSYLRGHSHLFRFIGLASVDNYRKIFNKNKNNNGLNPFDLNHTERIFKKINDELKNFNIPFVVVILPEFNSNKLKAKHNTLLNVTLNSFKTFLTEKKIDFLYLQDSFDKKIKTNNLTFKHSHHFNATGHQYIADQITSFLASSSLINK